MYNKVTIIGGAVLKRLLEAYNYNVECNKGVAELFTTLSSKRRKHLINIHKNMDEFLYFYELKFTSKEKDALLFASKYHDLGYHTDLEFTGNHALDFVLYLLKSNTQCDLTLKLILFHTFSDEYLRNEIIASIKSTLSDRDKFLIHLLSYFDLHTNLKGDNVSLESRLFSVNRRKKLTSEFIDFAKSVRDEVLHFMFNSGPKAIVCDVDNTISFDNHISEENIRQLKFFSDNGYEVIFNTGKLPHSIYVAEHEMGFNVHKICLNGNLISKDKTDLRILKNINIYKDDLIKLLNRNKIEYIEYTKNGVVLNDAISNENIEKIKAVGDYYPDKNENGIVIKVICFVEPFDKMKKAVLDQYVKGKSISVIRTSEYFYEVVPNINNKGTGLLELLNDLQIYHRATLAFGDNYNDLPMFKYAGKGYILDNATYYLKRRGYDVLTGDTKIAVGKKLEEL